MGPCMESRFSFAEELQVHLLEVECVKLCKMTEMQTGEEDVIHLKRLFFLLRLLV